MVEEYDHKERVVKIKKSFYQGHNFYRNKDTTCMSKQVIFIRAASKGLITLRRVLIIRSCFCFTLKTMFNLSWGGELDFFF